MGKRTEYQHGTFCWPELGTSNPKEAKPFYGELFGWKVKEMPMDGGGAYYMWQLKDNDVGAMYQLMDEQVKQGVPPHWMSYISVDNLDATLTQLTNLGGKIHMGPRDINDAGRMAIIEDPQGAVVALWQAKRHKGAQLVNEAGTFCWNELAAKDAEAAEVFYCNLLGWTTKTTTMEKGSYTTFMNGEAMAGGLIQMTEEWGDIPSHWMIYFTVKDTDAHCEKVKQLGGTVCVGPFDIPEVGRFAVVNDPQGAFFSIIDLIAPDA
jgi:hypothetical protein